MKNNDELDCQYRTERGKLYNTKIEDFFNSKGYAALKGKVQLIFTSPPFPLNKKKQYGNLLGNAFEVWFSSLAPKLCELLSDDGSIVIEMGNAWEKGSPIMSTLPLESLLSFMKKGKLFLCEEFISYNPSRLPSPAQWVTIERIRVTDSYTRLWWMSKTQRPKADNRRILRPYSKKMIKLLETKKYNSGHRPSNHNINSKSFLKNNNGSISHNVIQVEPIDNDKENRMPVNVFSISNSASNDNFIIRCKEKKILPHPARMPIELPLFFVEFLTDIDDIVFDPFAGSNTTGFAAERSKRQWVSIEAEKSYAEQSELRFDNVIK